MEYDISAAAVEYMKTHDGNFYAEDNKVTLYVGSTAVDVESIWLNKKEKTIYLHVGCKEFEGDLDIESLSEENQERMMQAFGIDVKRDKKYTQKQMENAVMLAGSLWQRFYNAKSTQGYGTLEVVMTIIHEACNMERWIAEKYGEDDEEYLDREEEYETMLEKKYELEENVSGYFSISSLHRDDLEAAGFDASNVDDATMERMADKMGDDYVTQLFWEHLPFFAEEFGVPRKEGWSEEEDDE